jgi:predicted ABC-type ATPase
MIAGPNGAGKSTLTRMLMAQGVDLGAYINADDIEHELGEPPGEDRTRRAQRIAEDRRRACMTRGRTSHSKR